MLRRYTSWTSLGKIKFHVHVLVHVHVHVHVLQRYFNTTRIVYFPLLNYPKVSPTNTRTYQRTHKGKMLTQLKKREEPGSDKAVDDKVEAAVENKEEVGDGREDEHPSWEAVHCLFVCSFFILCLFVCCAFFVCLF